MRAPRSIVWWSAICTVVTLLVTYPTDLRLVGARDACSMVIPGDLQDPGPAASGDPDGPPMEPAEPGSSSRVGFEVLTIGDHSLVPGSPISALLRVAFQLWSMNTSAIEGR